MNSVNLVGRVVEAPELRYTAAGDAVTTLRIAVDRPYGTKENRKTDFFPVVAWRKLAENIVTYVVKGQLVAVEGRLENRQYETQAGEKRYVTEIQANHVHFLTKPSNGNGNGGGAPAAQAPEEVATF